MGRIPRKKLRREVMDAVIDNDRLLRQGGVFLPSLHSDYRKKFNRKGGNKVDRDPVCKRKMNRNKAFVTIQYKRQKYYLCCPLCQSEFEKDPEKYAQKK